MYTLTLDIGGTNPRIAIVSDTNDILEIEKLTEEIELIPQINEYLKKVSEKNITTNICCIAASGVVKNNSAMILTNSKLTVNSEEIIKETYLENILVINDFEAIAYATKSPKLQIEEITDRQEKPESGNVAIIGPGTGLGVAFIINNQVVPSEGGHSSPPSIYPNFLEWLERKLHTEEICAETILSGKGISYLYEFKTGQEFAPEKIAKSKDPLAKTCMRMFMSYLGYFAQDMALTTLTNKAVYLAGGILPKNKDVLKDGTFLNSFTKAYHKEKVPYLEKIPIYLIDDYDCSFLGCKIASDEKFR